MVTFKKGGSTWSFIAYHELRRYNLRQSYLIASVFLEQLHAGFYLDIPSPYPHEILLTRHHLYVHVCSLTENIHVHVCLAVSLHTNVHVRSHTSKTLFHWPQLVSKRQFSWLYCRSIDHTRLSVLATLPL